MSGFRSVYESKLSFEKVFLPFLCGDNVSISLKKPAMFLLIVYESRINGDFFPVCLMKSL